MKRPWQFALVAVASLSIGAALDEVRHRIRDQHSAEIFEQRVRCRSLADEYAKKNSDNNNTFFVDHVDFSPSRHSCIAATLNARGEPGDTFWTYQTVDIITGERLFTGECSDNDKSSIFCGNGRNVQLGEKRDKAMETTLSKE